MFTTKKSVNISRSGKQKQNKKPNTSRAFSKINIALSFPLKADYLVYEVCPTLLHEIVNLAFQRVKLETCT